VLVSAVDDALAEGSPHIDTITHTAASADTNYDGIGINNVVANIIDNDTPAGVTISESGGTTDVTEGGAADSYSVVLDSLPTSNVDVTVTPDSQTDLGAGAGTAIVLSFTPANALTPQGVNVTAEDDAVVEGPHTGTITHASVSTDTNYDGITINNVVANITDNDGSQETVLYLSLKTSATLTGGLTVANEDILDFDGTDLSLFFDGSDVGLAGTNVAAFAVIAADEILLSFSSPETIPGIIGTVEDSDIVKFTATGLGDTTSGTFELFFRGSDSGLSPTLEDIDALELHNDGRLIVSTIANFAVTGVSGRDEDLIAFTPLTPGDYSSGTWEVYFDGSDVELSGEDVYATTLDANGDIHLSTTNAFAVTGVSGNDEDVFTFTPSQLGANTAGTYGSSLLFDGSLFGLDANDVNAIDIPTNGGAGDALLITRRAAVSVQSFAVEIYNPKYDVSGDGAVTALDALQVVNSVSVLNVGSLTDRQIDDMDVNEDGTLSALDALFVVNYLSRGSVAQSESFVLAAPTVSQPDPDASRSRAILELMDEMQLGVQAKDLF
jgi:hypothetical protein